MACCSRHNNSRTIMPAPFMVKCTLRRFGVMRTTSRIGSLSLQRQPFWQIKFYTSTVCFMWVNFVSKLALLGICFTQLCTHWAEWQRQLRVYVRARAGNVRIQNTPPSVHAKCYPKQNKINWYGSVKVHTNEGRNNKLIVILNTEQFSGLNWVTNREILVHCIIYVYS